MKKRKLPLVLSGILVTLVVVLIYASWANEVKELSGNSGEQRADAIAIDTLADFGVLERPEVVFLHDTHTDALEKKNKDCTICHLTDRITQPTTDQDRLSLKFKRLIDIDRQESMDIYHSECMGCHREMSAAGEKTGPVEVCGECHREKPRATPSRQPMGFDKSLHFRHSKTNNDKCERCHHEYDKETKRLFYAKEQEGSCRYCHRKALEENRISMRLASHLSCIDCHRKTLAKNENAGPIKCSGCHDPKKQQMIEKLKYVPRIKRKQPDVVLVQIEEQKKDKAALAGKMHPVPFDHKAHEEHNDTCRVCHHETLDSCTKKCHTREGSKKGKDVRLEQAMHQMDTEKSCMGCHEMSKRDRNCAGCHVFMEKGGNKDEVFCLTCHMQPLDKIKGAELKPEVIAKILLQSRKKVPETYKDEDIPEKVIIKGLADKYEPVEFPHRKIVHALIKNIKDNKLANYFHRDKGTLCQACHHNSPADKKPPRCISCHGKPFDEKNMLRPGMKAAYHQQCMGCHREMGIKKPMAVECIECHKERKIPEKDFFGRPL